MLYILSILVVIFDQLIKILIKDNLYFGQSRPVLPNIFHLTYVKNTGAAFGILQQHNAIFIGITLLIISILILVNFKIERSLIYNIAAGLIIGGAVGNLIDRITLGYVVDYLDFRIWPVFNLADSAIVIGVGILFIYILKFEDKEI